MKAAPLLTICILDETTGPVTTDLQEYPMCRGGESGWGYECRKFGTPIGWNWRSTRLTRRAWPIRRSKSFFSLDPQLMVAGFPNDDHAAEE
jgi:hypothetical protein